MGKYRFYNSDSKVVAVSSYAGKPVRGVAKCGPQDSFNLEKGKALAEARCNLKVAQKRAKRAYEKYNEALAAFSLAHDNLERMISYCTDAENAVDSAYDTLTEIEARM